MTRCWDYPSDGPVPCPYCKEVLYVCRYAKEDASAYWPATRVERHESETRWEREIQLKKERENAVDPEYARCRQEKQEREASDTARRAAIAEKERAASALRKRQLAYMLKHGLWEGRDAGSIIIVTMPEGWEEDLNTET